jgi:hypothetical protein
VSGSGRKDLADQIRPVDLSDWGRTLDTEVESAQVRALFARRAPGILDRLQAALPDTSITRLDESRLRIFKVLLAASPESFGRAARRPPASRMPSCVFRHSLLGSRPAGHSRSPPHRSAVGLWSSALLPAASLLYAAHRDRETCPHSLVLRHHRAW